MKNKTTLLTNIDYVSLAHVPNFRMSCYALVVEESKKQTFGDGPGLVVRGFLTDGCLQVFQLWLDAGKEMPFTVSTAQADNRFVMMKGEKLEPLFTHCDLKFAGGTGILAYLSDSAREIDVVVFEPVKIKGEKKARIEYEKVWSTLKRKVAEYWTAPYMPVHIGYGPPLLIKLSAPTSDREASSQTTGR